MTDALRETDALGRGDEGLSALMLLLETDVVVARIAGDRFVSSFAKRMAVLAAGDERVIPVSLAIANYPDDGQDADALLERASSRAG